VEEWVHVDLAVHDFEHSCVFIHSQILQNVLNHCVANMLGLLLRLELVRSERIVNLPKGRVTTLDEILEVLKGWRFVFDQNQKHVQA